MPGAGSQRIAPHVPQICQRPLAHVPLRSQGASHHENCGQTV